MSLSASAPKLDRHSEANKERKAKLQKLRNKRYYEANKEHLLEMRKKYREAHRDRIAEENKRWYEANKERLREKALHRWRTLMHGDADVRQRVKNYYEAGSTELSDVYVKRLLCKGTTLRTNQIPQSLIGAMRAFIKLHRLIKEKSK